MNTTNTKQIHQLIGVVIALEGMLDTVDDGLVGVRNVLAQIANKETADTPEKVKTTPEHPEYLETEDDYDNAPEGTIVAEDAGTPALHSMAVWCYGDRTLDSAEMEGEPRRVLRWGWEA